MLARKPSSPRIFALVVTLLPVLVACSNSGAPTQESVTGTTTPAKTAVAVRAVDRSRKPVRLVFIHHSCGENWLADEQGGLGKSLQEEGYFVSDTNYGWGPNAIGDRTDITDWPEWFTSAESGRYLDALLHESGKHSDYSRTITNPGGENQIVIFKSCFPNSQLEGRPDDTPVRGQGLTVSNTKAIYNELLGFFSSRPDKLFILVTAPPLQDASHAANARALNNWLVREWLADYRGQNVAVFDFYNVLTHPENHHRVVEGKIEHVCDQGGDTLYYDSDGDDHPSIAGNRKATREFVPLLNHYYRRWAATLPRESVVETPRRVDPPLVSARQATTARQSPTVPQASSPAGQVIDNFDKRLAGWSVFSDEGNATRLTFQPDRDTRQGGTAALHLQYDIEPGGWGTCSLVYDQPRDWSQYAGLTMYLHGERVGQQLRIVVYGGESSQDLQHFEFDLQIGEQMVRDWQRVTIRWSQLKLAAWQGEADTPFDARAALGVALAFEAPEDARRVGQIWIDEIALLSAPPE